MTHHRRALFVIIAAVVLDAALGLLFAGAEHVPAAHGLYCGLANAVTVGCDIAPRTVAGYVVSALECALIVPLFAATFSLFTSGLTSVHVAASEQRVKAHIERRLREHLREAGGTMTVAVADGADATGSNFSALPSGLGAVAGYLTGPEGAK